MKVLKKAVFTLALVALVVCSLSFAPASYASGKPVYQDGNVLFETEMWRGAWCEPEGKSGLEIFKDCGFNSVMLMNEVQYDTAKFRQYLANAEEVGIRVLFGGGQNRSAPKSFKSAKQTEVFSQKAFYGLSVCDEPLGSATATPGVIGVPATAGTNYEEYATIWDYIRQEYLDFKDRGYLDASASGANETRRIFEVIISNSSAEGTFGYYALRTYCENVLTYMDDQDKLISIDLYPYSYDERTGEKSFSKGGRKGYLNRLMEMRYFIDKYDVGKTMVYYQNWFRDELLPFIDKGILTHQFYTIMAFGVKGLNCWYYDMYWRDFTTANEVMVDEYGQLTDLWYYNKEAFAEIIPFENVYLAFCDDWQGVITIDGSVNHYDDVFENLAGGLYSFGEGAGETFEDDKTPNYVKNHLNMNVTQLKSYDATGDTLIGVMKDKNGNTGYMVTNQNFYYDYDSDVVNLTFDGVNKAIVWQNGEEKIVNLNNGALSLNLPNGGGAFVIPYAD